MGLPTSRYQTFVTGDSIDAAFLNAWVQDYMIGLRSDVDGHLADTTDPHGATMTVTTKVVAPLFESSSPGETRYLDVSAFQPDEDFAAYRRFTAQGDLYSSATDTTTYTALGPMPLRPGDVLTAIALKVNRTAGQVSLKIRERTGGVGGMTEVVTLTCNSGSGVTTVNWSGSYTVPDDKSLQGALEVTNNGSSADIYTHTILLTFSRTKR